MSFSFHSESPGKVLLEAKLDEMGYPFIKHGPPVFRINVFECGK